MTVILGVAGRHFSFLAADTARYDMHLKKPLDPVEKLYASKSLLVGKAGAGSVVDPHLAAAFAGFQYDAGLTSFWRDMAARDSAVQQAQADACDRNSVPFYQADYALVVGTLGEAGVCRGRRFPGNQSRKAGRYGICVAGTKEAEVSRDAETAMKKLAAAESGKVNLAGWASDVIKLAAERSSPFVDFPIDCALLVRHEDKVELHRQRFCDQQSAWRARRFTIPAHWMKRGL